jgi:hypothetical protein
MRGAAPKLDKQITRQTSLYMHHQAVKMLFEIHVLLKLMQVSSTSL